jgi:pimeloyl-ACP methyl ester carboxylesterase
LIDRQNLILVPGLCCTERLFRDQKSDLADDFDVQITEEHLAHKDIGEIAAAILSAAPEYFALGGLSFGGYICFEIWRQAPARVTHLALMNTSAAGDDAGKAAARRDLINLAENGRFLGIPDRLWPHFIDPSRHQDINLIEAVKKMVLGVGSKGFLRQQQAIMSRPDSLQTLATISCPTLVLVGRNDERTPVQNAEQIHDGIPGSELIILEDCGHLSSMEQPAAVTSHLRDLLKQ